MVLRIISALIDGDGKLRFSFFFLIINMLMSDENYSSVRHFRCSIFKNVFAEIEVFPFFALMVGRLYRRELFYSSRTISQYVH